MIKNCVVLLCLVFLMASCSDDENQLGTSTKTVDNSLHTGKDELKVSFGKALVQGLAESQSFRDLIKNESLKMFDNDFDILYLVIKDKELNDGMTVRELLIKHLPSDETMTHIEQQIPLLTIFVPELPENTFSAALWNTGTQIPSVAVSSNETNDVLIINSDLEESILASDLIPGFPVVVVKENERIVVKEESNSKISGRTFKSNDDITEFVFLADCFDRSVTSSKANRTTYSIDQKLIDAYDIYSSEDGWHRDYVYYDITPSQPNGPFSYDFQEHLTSFSMTGDPTSAYSKIADATADPKKRGPFASGSIPTQNAGWTGGYYEFKVRVLLNARNGIGEEFVSYFSAIPSELFVLQYNKSFNVFYTPVIVGFNTKMVNLPIFNWDLNNYASTIKIEIEEVDLTTTTTTTDTRTIKFATNFGIEGVLKKLGLKFGASAEETQTQTISKTYTEGNDQLGSVIINFADNVIVSTGNDGEPYWVTRDYNSGWFIMSLEPMRVQ